MYKVGDLVVYSTHGVCEVIYIGSIDLPMIDKNKKYYTLAPITKREQVVYASVENDSSTMRAVLSKKEANTFLKKIPSIEPAVITNEKERENFYKGIVRSCDLYKIAGLIKTLLERREERENLGKKVTVLDDKYYRQAENQICGELSVVLDIKKEDIISCFS